MVQRNAKESLLKNGQFVPNRLTHNKNDKLLLRFFPDSQKEVQLRKREYARALETSTENIAKHFNILPPSQRKQGGKSAKRKINERLYLITSLEEPLTLRAPSLRSYAQRLGVDVTTSYDLASDTLWTLNQAVELDKHFNRSNAIFALVTRTGLHSPNVWIEIERAYASGKLKAIFIDESAYTVTLMGRYPCVLLKRSVKQSVDDFIAFFKGVFQHWGRNADRWFWCGLATILSQHDFPIISEN